MKRKYLVTLPLILVLSAVSCTKAEGDAHTGFGGLKKTGSMELNYAEMFSVDYYEDDISMVTIGGSEQYLIVPEKSDLPDGVPDDVTVIRQPAENIYVAASSAMDLFDGIGALGSVRMTSTQENNWALPAIREAMDSGSLLYAGKYSAPDYEMIVDEDCALAIESTMVYHCPEVREQLEKMGIPVIVERSSYESHPLGRMEWIKVYGLLTGKAEEAEQFFDEKVRSLDSFIGEDPTGRTVAFFSINANGAANIHKPGDYVSKMIELAGGVNAIGADELDIDDNALSTMNIQFETFYECARDADILIYNSAIDGGITSLDELTAKSSLLADFKAVKENSVWCTDKNLFQQGTGAADIIADMHLIFTDGDSAQPTYFYRVT